MEEGTMNTGRKTERETKEAMLLAPVGTFMFKATFMPGPLGPINQYELIPVGTFTYKVTVMIGPLRSHKPNELLKGLSWANTKL
jgi:hypothetical protein